MLIVLLHNIFNSCLSKLAINYIIQVQQKIYCAVKILLLRRQAFLRSVQQHLAQAGLFYDFHQPNHQYQLADIVYYKMVDTDSLLAK